jgi:hypothetical protein
MRTALAVGVVCVLGTFAFSNARAIAANSPSSSSTASVEDSAAAQGTVRSRAGSSRFEVSVLITFAENNGVAQLRLNVPRMVLIEQVSALCGFTDAAKLVQVIGELPLPDGFTSSPSDENNRVSGGINATLKSVPSPGGGTSFVPPTLVKILASDNVFFQLVRDPLTASANDFCSVGLVGRFVR